MMEILKIQMDVIQDVKLKIIGAVKVHKMD